MDFAAVAQGKKKKPAPPPAKAAPFDLEGARSRFSWVHEEIDRLKGDAELVTIATEDHLKGAVAMAGQAKALTKKIEEQRKAIIEEPSGFVKAVNAFAKDFTSKLEMVESGLKRKIADYQYRLELERREAERKAQEEARRLQEQLRREAEEKNRLAREEAQRKAEEEARARQATQAEIEAAKAKAAEESKQHEIEAPTVLSPVMPKAETVARAETGATSHVRKQWKGEVITPDEVPREYCSPDSRKIRDAVNAGIRSIPGVRIFEDIQSVIRT